METIDSSGGRRNTSRTLGSTTYRTLGSLTSRASIVPPATESVVPTRRNTIDVEKQQVVTVPIRSNTTKGQVISIQIPLGSKCRNGRPLFTIPSVEVPDGTSLELPSPRNRVRRSPRSSGARGCSPREEGGLENLGDGLLSISEQQVEGKPTSERSSSRVSPLDLSTIGRRPLLISRTARSPRATVRTSRTRPMLTERRTARTKPLLSAEVSRALARAKVHRPPEAFKPFPLFQKLPNLLGNVQLASNNGEPQVVASNFLLAISSIEMRPHLANTSDENFWADPTAKIVNGAQISGKVTIGAGTVISSTAKISGGDGGIVIGSHCLVDDYAFIENRLDGQLEIGDFVWISCRAVLKSPKSVGKGAVVGSRGMLMENSILNEFEKMPIGGVLPMTKPFLCGNSQKTTEQIMSRLLRSFRSG